MKLSGIDRRLAALEVDAKPRVISSLLDLMNYIGENEDVELSQELQELVEIATNEKLRAVRVGGKWRPTEITKNRGRSSKKWRPCRGECSY